MARPTVNIGKCIVEGCEKDIKALQFCSMHYERFKKHGNTNDISRKQAYSDDDKCSIKGCRNKMRSSHLCNNHYMNFYYHKSKGSFDAAEQYILHKNS